MEPERFYICDVRSEFARNPYVTFWRPQNSGYAYPLAWSGEYDRESLKPGYHEVFRGKTIERFPVPCETAKKLATISEPRTIDGGPTEVVKNTEKNRRALRKMRLALAC